jgi:hypothetical protein
MTWLGALIAVIVIAFFAIAYPGFRKFLLAVFAGLVALGVRLYLYFENESRQHEKREQQARTLIGGSDVEFQNLRLSNSYGPWKVNGVVKNNSRHPIEKIKLAVEISNCDGNNRNCTIVETDDVASYLDIPPGQARGLDIYVTFRSLPRLTDWTGLIELTISKPNSPRIDGLICNGEGRTY